MKKYIIGIAIVLMVFTLNAQRVVEKQIAVKSTSSIDLKLDFADSIKIKQSKDNTVKIKAIISINDNLNNDKYELITDEGSDLLRVSAKIHDMKSIRIPCNNRKGSNYNYHDGECLTIDISYEIEIPTIANLKLETISGNIIIDNALSSMSINSISGFIDMGLSSNANSDLKIETVTGGVYTNHDFKKKDDHFDSSPGGTDARFTIGSGEMSMKLTTISGDIFLRKI